MSVDYIFPSPTDLKDIERVKLPDLILDDPFFESFPIEESELAKLVWRQRDIIYGAQAVRGLGGTFPVVQGIGAKEYVMDPNYYGESAEIDEEELTNTAELSQFSRNARMADLIGFKVDQLLQRRVTRIRKTLIDTLTTGVFTITDKAGTIKGKQEYAIQKPVVSVSWSDRANATPFADIVALRRRSLGFSTSFGKGAVLLLNPVQIDNVLQNRNAADVFGRRTDYGATFNSVAQINKLLGNYSDSDDMPTIMEYRKDWYPTETGPAEYFLPDSYGILIGKRDNNDQIGAYRMTINAQNGNQEEGAYTFVRDLGPMQSPRKIVIEDGHNAGVVMFYPSSVVSLKVVL